MLYRLTYRELMELYRGALIRQHEEQVMLINAASYIFSEPHQRKDLLMDVSALWGEEWDTDALKIGKKNRVLQLLEHQRMMDEKGQSYTLPNQCKHPTNQGERCKRNAVNIAGYCKMHTKMLLAENNE